MKKIYYLMAAMTLATSMAGCSDDTYGLEGEGTMMLKATINSDVKVVSRADVTESYGESLVLWISNDKGAVRKFNGIDNLPTTGVKLVAGSYVAEGWAGDSVPASWDKKYFKGRQAFEITNGQTTPVNLECKIANVVTSVKFDATVDDVLESGSYTLTVESTRGSLTFDSGDANQDLSTLKGYFMMPSGRDANDTKDLKWTINGTKKSDGSAYKRTGTIASAKPGYEYAFNIKCQGESDEIGGGYLTVEISENEILVEDTIEIVTAPTIAGYQFDLSEPIYGEEGSFGRHSLWVMACEQLKSVVLESTLLADAAHFNIGGNDIDLLACSPEYLATLKTGGLTVVYPWVGKDASGNPTSDNTKMKISFETSLLNSLNNGEYEFKVTATDNNDRTSEAVFKVVVSDAKTAVLSIETSGVDFSARSATLRGKVTQEGVSTVGFEYRTLNSGDWTYVAGTPVSRSLAVDTEFTAYVTDLKPGTTYEYRSVADGISANATKQFTTEPATQLPNSGFEDWQTSSSPYLIYPSGGQMFWDSGNHGSATMRKNVTTPDGTIKHSGNYSILLTSQFVGVGSIGRFAAGNVFVGKYLGTDGTDGILGFGRPFTGRPVKLRGYVKYDPVAISHKDDDAPAEYVKGDMDRGVIYIALLDGTTDSEYPEFPVVIKTKTKQLFSKDAANVVAYGELVFNATPGTGMVEFELPLTYKRTDIRPSFILCTCSASKGGDYFTGGSGSKMWLDDLELVY